LVLDELTGIASTAQMCAFVTSDFEVFVELADLN
jgi:hypothetical protein